jgi:Protein of unknown function (DUF429)
VESGSGTGITEFHATEARPSLVQRLRLRVLAVARRESDHPYPAAALREWKLPAKGYKRNLDVRVQLLAQLSHGSWLDVGAFGDELVLTDHALDAFISAVVARAASRCKTTRAPSLLRADAEVEGWIHLPEVLPRELVDIAGHEG